MALCQNVYRRGAVYWWRRRMARNATNKKIFINRKCPSSSAISLAKTRAPSKAATNSPRTYAAIRLAGNSTFKFTSATSGR